MYEVAPQPDSYSFSTSGRWSEPWHFLNINAGETSYNVADCPNPPACNVAAIQNFSQILGNSGAGGPFCSSENSPTTVLPCPLIWLIHVVGDVHQPLHCGYGSDRGGNSINVSYMGTQTELHAVWDTQMIYTYLDSQGNGDWYDLYQYLSNDLAQHPNRESGFAAVRNPVTWANESISYVPNCYNWNPTSLTRQGEPQLGQDYYNHNFPIVTLRLQAAGVRLAALLNSVFPGNEEATPQKEHLDSALEHQLTRLKQVAADRAKATDIALKSVKLAVKTAAKIAGLKK